MSAELSSEAPKLYSPFDEPQPKIPAEILSDKRLDKRITVTVKSMNMKDLFWEIRRLTGVSVIAAKDLSGERPIVLFHDKPLRDVMTEISALYGYYWLARGRKDAWTYELFEDVRHSKRRNEVRESQDAMKIEGLLDVIEMVHRIVTTGGEAGLAQLRRVNPRLYEMVSDPGRIELIKFFGSMDRKTLRGLLNDIGMVRRYEELPSGMQSSLLKAINVESEQRFAIDGPTNGTDSAFQPWTDSELQSAIVTVKRWRNDVFSPPHITLKVSVPAAEGRPGKSFINAWPNYSPDEPDMIGLPEVPPGRVIGDPLPKDTQITIKQTREQLYDGEILVGDVLDAIARQANLSVIADYYFQETSLPACSDEPLEKLVSELCKKMGYTCQVEKDTLRFRFNKWFLQPLPEEPSKIDQESWWRKIENTGSLSLDDLLDIACLPGNQTFWGGFRFVPGAWQARLFPRTARLVRMLGSVLEAQACTPEGLSVSELDADQFSRITDWAGVMGIKQTPEELLKCVIRIEKSGDPVNSLQFRLLLPDGTPRGVPLNARLECLDEAARRTIAMERAAELAADKIELSVPSGR